MFVTQSTSPINGYSKQNDVTIIYFSHLIMHACAGAALELKLTQVTMTMSGKQFRFYSEWVKVLGRGQFTY